MVTYKNITVKKRGGGTRKQRVMVLKSGKYRFVKNIGSKTKRKKSSKVKKTKGGKKRTMARKNKNRSSRKFTIPLGLTAAGGVILFQRLPSGSSLWTDIRTGNMPQMGYDLQELIGIEAPTGRFRMDYLFRNLLTPLIVGLGIHKIIGGMLGVNRMLGRYKVPFIRL